MALKIIKADQPMEVKNLTMCLYAPPGLGKTSTAYTAKNPLLLDFDKGAYRSQFRKDTVEINEWSDIESLSVSDLADYDTIIVDTAGRALDVLQAHLINSNPKLKNANGQLTLAGFGALKATFTAWLKQLHTLGKDVILLAHMDEQRNGDDIIERLDIQGGSKNEVYKVADVMGRIKFDDKQGRIIDFNPSSSGFGKNPAQLELIKIPNFSEAPNFFTVVVDSIKEKLNEKSAQAKIEDERLQSFRADLEGILSLDEFNQLLVELAKAKPIDKRILIDVAKSKGFEFNKKTKQFEAENANDSNISD